MEQTRPELLHALSSATAGLFGGEFLRRLLRVLCDELDVALAFVAELEEDSHERLHVFAYCRTVDTEWDAVEEVPGPPLTDVLDEDVVENAQRLRDRYPGDAFFDDLGVESAFAVPLTSSDGRYIGHLGVMDVVPRGPTPGQVDVLAIIGARVALEIERRRSERALRKAAEEQAALRRVATLVAQGVPPEQLLDAVTSEACRLFGGQTANLTRFEDDGYVRVMGAWAGEGASALQPGEHYRVDNEATTTAMIKQTGAPARQDSYDQLAGALAERLRAIGIRSAIGAPITVDGNLWGAINVSTTREAPFPEGAELRLRDFADLFAQAVANAEARHQLTESRARMAEAAVAERRRLERNLHDGAQQRLVMLSLSLRIAESRADGEGAELLREASTELATALEELRELARGIHPAVLTERGLVVAIEGLLARAPLPVRLEAGVHVRPSAAVEAAAYYVVAEALTNVAKYAEATTATVRAAENDGLIWVEVEDDGVGGANAAHGSGLAGLADRVEALGGRLEVRSRPGEGTLVRAEIPSRSRAD
jgi:signal transduction histidine kinase